MRNYANRFTPSLVKIALIVTCFACGKDSPTSPPAADSISLSSITPADGTKLAPGSTVNISATVAFHENCSADGTIVMRITDQNGTVLSPDVKATAPSGDHSKTLTNKFSVPSSGVTRVTVTLALIPNDT